VQGILSAPDSQSLSVPPPGSGVECIRLYGWDSQSETWFGPNELGRSSLPDKRLLRALRAVSGKSWYGRVSGHAPDGPEARFFILVHNLSDCAVASIYCDESKAGPVELVAAIPSRRRSRLRDEFAFEFLAYAHFLGALSAGSELQVQEGIAAAVAGQGEAETFVFSISSGLWPSDLDPVLSRCVEKVAVTLCQWLDEPAAGQPGNTPPDRVL
jgi:hypothetical protein